MNVQTLPLHEEHAALGAKFGTFGVWQVPLYYSSILEEHERVRRRAGLFDVSHMGAYRVEGPKAEYYLDRLITRRLVGVEAGRAVYSPICREDGGILDDIIVYKVRSDRFWVIVNAANAAKDYEWLHSHLEDGVKLSDLSREMGLLALQGPASVPIAARVLGHDFFKLGNYRFQEWQGGIVARTGYTGEIGLEILLPHKEIARWWAALIKGGKQDGLIPVGFAARDTLRLEAGMLLYGQDMDEEVDPFAAGIGWTVDLKKNAFVGKEAILKRRQNSKRQLVGIEVVDRGIPRHGCEIYRNQKKIGAVTSGSFSPTLKKNIALGYVTIENAEIGTEVEISLRDRFLKALVVKLPFYRSSQGV
ncbi:MAG: glycine cleavage system aminomethyltransferase GcvT [Candidatus Omnitrophica bacterium]|nr:glycine cleavage system aminomethyltransferase GcvT [Candidatus Omnitrophota bacterium]